MNVFNPVLHWNAINEDNSINSGSLNILYWVLYDLIRLSTGMCEWRVERTKAMATLLAKRRIRKLRSRSIRRASSRRVIWSGLEMRRQMRSSLTAITTSICTMVVISLPWSSSRSGSKSWGTGGPVNRLPEEPKRLSMRMVSREKNKSDNGNLFATR